MRIDDQGMTVCLWVYVCDCMSVVHQNHIKLLVRIIPVGIHVSLPHLLRGDVSVSIVDSSSLLCFLQHRDKLNHSKFQCSLYSCYWCDADKKSVKYAHFIFVPHWKPDLKTCTLSFSASSVCVLSTRDRAVPARVAFLHDHGGQFCGVGWSAADARDGVPLPRLAGTSSFYHLPTAADAVLHLVRKTTASKFLSFC